MIEKDYTKEELKLISLGVKLGMIHVANLRGKNKDINRILDTDRYRFIFNQTEEVLKMVNKK